MVNDDKEIDDYLEGNSELSKQYHSTAMAEPSERLNEKILAAAKDAAAPKQKSKVLFHKSPWVRPVSIAAMITLSVSLVVTMQQESGQPLMSAPGSSVEPYNSTVLSEEIVMPQTVTADDMFVLDEVELRQSNDERVVAPAALGTVGGYHAESNADVMKDEATVQPVNKALLKQKERSKEVEKRVFAKEQLLQSAPMEADVNVVMENKQDPQRTLQEEGILEIKNLLLEGKIEESKGLYKEFIRKYPGYSNDAIEEIIGAELFGLIK
ncbi:MAG: hypothetical protein ACI85N_001342 [Gammaproteobacteria bacterium]|jgi:hypothetical protein